MSDQPGCQHVRRVKVTNAHKLWELRCGECDLLLASEFAHEETDEHTVTGLTEVFEQELREALSPKDPAA